MLTSRKDTLRPLLESAQGVHLTAYLINRGDLSDLKAQLREAIEQYHEWINPVMSGEERNRFLEPLVSLLHDPKILKQMKGNIGVFRNQESFRILNIPIEVEQSCQVATSFHVKPLLRWLQSDEEFLFLGVTKSSAHLYWGSQDSFRLVDSVVFDDIENEQRFLGATFSGRAGKKRKLKNDEVCTFLSDWIGSLTKGATPRLFWAGETAALEIAGKSFRYKNMCRTPVAAIFDPDNLNDVCALARKMMKEEAVKVREMALLEFRIAEQGKRTRKNIFQIAKAVVRGRVRKLIVTDELCIFGKIDKSSGGLAIHPFDLDHEDDDLLDDLAQMVLSQGGEVIIASREEIPKGRPILAILDDDGRDFEKVTGLMNNAEGRSL